jgi:hypothetical protein
VIKRTSIERGFPVADCTADTTAAASSGEQFNPFFQSRPKPGDVLFPERLASLASGGHVFGQHV